MIAGFLTASGVVAPGTALAVTGSGGLMPAPGQFFPVTPVKVLDTRDGTGGVSVAPLAAGATVTFTATGAGGVPPAGDVSDVYVVITAASPQDNGCLHDYDAALADPNLCTVSFEAGQNMIVSDIVQVSSSGQVSVTNASGGTTDVAASVMGYFQANDPQTLDTQVPGDTYVPVAQAQIVDTRSGLGAPHAQIPGGGSLTVQVTGAGGVPADAAGAALFIGAANATSAGTVSAYPTGGTASSLGIVRYQAGRTARDLYFGALSSSGQLTLVNNGSGPVDVMVGVQGYLVSPAAGEAGSGYQDVAESRIVDTRNGTGGVPTTPIPANGSITFTATGVDGVPGSGVPSVAESVAAIGPTASGYLSVYPASGTDPGNPGVNFTSGDSQDNDMSAPVLSAVSPTGRETITNHSSGTVDVVVSARGYYAAPARPGAPDSVSVSVSGTTATVTWGQPFSDGGAAITGYTVTASPDNATATVDGATTQATLSGLANASSDLFTVAAANAAGTSAPTTYSPPNVITGTVLAPDGATSVPGDLVDIYLDDPSSSSSTPSLIGTATTDSNGNWSFAVPQYAALPADAQTAASGNNGWLNVDAIGMGYATANQIPVAAVTVRSAWVGTSTQTQSPADVSALAQPAAIMRPDGPAPPPLTSAQAAAAYVAVNDPTATDASGNPTGNPDYAYQPIPTDKYGFQESGGDGSYNPNIASDGTTDVTHAAITPATASNSGTCNSIQVAKDLADQGAWTILGEYHSNWDDMGWFKYQPSAVSNIGVVVGVNNQDFDLSGSIKRSNGTGIGLGKGNGGTYDSHQVQIHEHYRETKWNHYTQKGILCYHSYQWESIGISRDPTSGTYSRTGKGINNDQNKAKTRWRTDGCTYALNNLYNAIQTDYGQDIGLNNYWFGDDFPEPGLTLTHKHGITYGLAAKFSFQPDPVHAPGLYVSIGFSAETDHTVLTEQGVEFDDANGMNTGPGGTAPTRQDPWPPQSGEVNTRHFFWGSNGPPSFSGQTQPRVFYNC